MDAHLIPRFYLGGFTDPDVPPGHDPFVWLWRFAAGSWQPKGPKNTATLPDYYFLEDGSGNKDESCEQFLNRIESDAAPAIRSLTMSCEGLSNRNRKALARFVAAMEVRLPSRIESMQAFIGEVAKATASRNWQYLRGDAGAYRRFTSGCRGRTGRDDPGEFLSDSMDPCRFEFTGTKELVLPALLKSVNRIARVLLAMNWYFLDSDGENVFITSDTPCCRFHPADMPPLVSGGLLDQRVELTLPLTSRVALLARWVGPRNGRMQATTDEVRLLNLRTACGAGQYIAAPKVVFPGVEEIREVLASRAASQNLTT